MPEKLLRVESEDALMHARVLMSLALALCLARPALCAQTSMFRANAQHTGVYQSKAVTRFHGVKWSFHTGDAVVSSPVVAGDTVYVGSNDGYLYAVDRETGKLRWRFATKSRVASSPAVAGENVYVGSYDGNMYAVNALSGKFAWKFQTQGERRFAGTHLHGFQPTVESMPDVFDVFLSSPTIWHGAVYFGSGDGNIYALDSLSGQLKWKFKTGDVVHASPAISDGTLFVGSWDSYFYALDATTGALRWRFKTGEDPKIHNQVGIQSSAAILDGIVYFGCRDSHLYALDARSGKLIWSFPTHGSWVVSSPAVENGNVYFATSDSGLFYALQARNGTVQFHVSFHQWPTFSSPSLAGDMAYVGSWAGTLWAIDLARGKTSWSFRTSAAQHNGAALTKPDGTPRYEAAYRSDFYDDMVIGFHTMMTMGSFRSSPVIAGGVVYVGSADGNLYALK